jgi:3beta-hydroxysteroid-4beta-carboxylate 3-dehydrogenase (decarboxylating)
LGQVLIDFARRRLRAYVAGGFEFVAARDIVEGHLLAMRKGRTGQKYIFSTEHMTIDALFDLFSRVTGQPKPAFRLPAGLMMGVAEISERVHRTLLPGRRQLLTPAAIRLLQLGRRADCSKARDELGYRPTSVAEAVQEAYDWFVARGMIPRPSSAALTDLAGRRTIG